jgi:hypothetical protein
MLLTVSECCQQTLFSDQVGISLPKVNPKLNLLIRQRAECAIHGVRLNHYFHGNRPSRLLAYKLRSNELI